MTETIEKRFLQFCDWFKGSRRLNNDRELSSTLGMSFSSLSMIRTGRRGLSISSLSIIAFNQPQLNTYWLLTGVGSMLDGKKVLMQTSQGIEEYVPTPYDPYIGGGKEDEDVYYSMRGAHHPTILDKTAQELLLSKREAEKWKDKYIECLEKHQKEE